MKLVNGIRIRQKALGGTKNSFIDQEIIHNDHMNFS